MAGRELTSEEDVKVKVLVPLLEDRGYRIDFTDFERTIEVHQGRKRKAIFADAVVHADARRKMPLVVAETKPPGERITKADKEQAISYARLLPVIAPLALVTNGKRTVVIDVFTKKVIKSLPTRADLVKSLKATHLADDQRAALQAEAREELFRIDDVQQFKRILKSCHNAIRNNEGYDPTQAFDELSKVMFCKLHEERRGANNRFRVEVFDDSLKRLNVNIVNTIFEETKKDPKYGGLFNDDDYIALHDRTVRKIVELFQDYDLSLTGFDVKGEAFEYFLGDTFTGGLGQYFTPRNVVSFITEAVDPKIDERIVDPFCGTGGFLIMAHDLALRKIDAAPFSAADKQEWRRRLIAECLVGTDWAERTSQACKMNLVVHGEGGARVFKHHGLLDVPDEVVEGRFDVCLTNPPFGSLENDPEVLERFTLSQGRRSQERLVLALERCLRLVRPGGVVGIVEMDGMLGNMTMVYVRDFVRRHAWIRAVVSLPRETFEGYGGRSDTSVLILERKEAPDEGDQEDIFMAVCENAGIAPNGDPAEGNQLPEILASYRAWRRGEPFDSDRVRLVSDLDDRLDPKFYFRADHVADADAAIQRVDDVRARVDRAAVMCGDISTALSELPADFPTVDVRLGDVLEQVRIRHEVDADRDYRTLGIRWWGGGCFVKERPGHEMKAKTVFEVREGWIVYNRLFAYRGSFAIVDAASAGTFASSEFPCFKVKDEVANGALVARYIVHALNSPQYLRQVDAASTGSTKTSRNRFLQGVFLDFTVAIPEDAVVLKQIVAMIDAADELRALQGDVSEQVRAAREDVATVIPLA